MPTPIGLALFLAGRIGVFSVVPLNFSPTFQLPQSLSLTLAKLRCLQNLRAISFSYALTKCLELHHNIASLNFPGKLQQTDKTERQKTPLPGWIEWGVTWPHRLIPPPNNNNFTRD